MSFNPLAGLMRLWVVGCESGIAETAAAAQLLDRHACFGLPQETNDLFVGKSALLHARHSPW